MLVNWSYRKKLTIDKDQVNSNLSNAIVLVHLTNANMNNFADVNLDGSDIRFTDADGDTLLDFDRVRHDASEAWYYVKIPSVSSSIDTDFYIYYGNASAVDGADSSSVYDAYYKAVYHLEANSSGVTDEFIDSTSNNHHGTGVNSPTQKTGFIGKGQQGGGTKYIDIVDSDDFYFDGDFTIEWKMYWESSVIKAGIMGQSEGGGSNPKWFLDWGNRYTNKLAFNVASGVYVQFAWIPSADTQYHCKLTRAGNDWKFYVNNVQTGGTQTEATALTNINANFRLLVIGELSYVCPAILDEVRISKGIARSEDEGSFYYQSDIDNVLTFNVQENNPTKQLSPSLEWSVRTQTELTPSIEWSSELAHKFTPNTINYPFCFDPLQVIDQINLINVSSCPVGYNIYMENTGSSGTTTVKIYLNSTLKDTINITADNASYSKTESLALTQFLAPGSQVKVEVSSVATDADNLRVNVYTMSFPFKMEKLFVGNLYSDSLACGINRNHLYKSADYWTIDLNQPIQNIINIDFLDETGETVDATAEITNGLFYRNRLKLTPYTDTNIAVIKIQLKDYQDSIQYFNISPVILDYMGNYPEYTSDAENSIDIYIPFASYSYSFDDLTYTSPEIADTDNSLTIDFTGESDGAKTVYMRYSNGVTTIEEVISITYITAEIDANVIFNEDKAKIVYSDSVPLDRVEVYYDNVLNITTSPLVKSGLSTITVNSTLKTVTVSSGYVYYGREKYTWAGTAYTIDPELADNDYKTNWRVLFGFNLKSLDFEYRTIPITDLYNLQVQEYESFIPFWVQDFGIRFESLDYLTWSMAVTSTSQDVFDGPYIDLNVLSTKTIKVRILDAASRTRDFTYNYFTTGYNIWRSLTVTKPSDASTLLPGEIHQEASLNLALTSEDWELDEANGVLE